MIGYLGLGANLGDRAQALRDATQRLDATDGVTVTRVSAFYETEPVGEITDQPAFLNAVAEIDTELGPVALLGACQAVERDGGRTGGGPKHGPRPIDVDVLLLGDLVRAEAPVLPHPGLLERRFVLVPLLELAPDVVVPGFGRAADARPPGEAWVRPAR